MAVESHACTITIPEIATGPDFLVTVADRGYPVSGLRLEVAGKRATTDARGVAAFYQIAPGRYYVGADRDDGVSDAVTLNVKANGPQRVQVHLAWPAVSPIEIRSLRGSLNLSTASTHGPSNAFDLDVMEALSGRVLKRGRATASGAFDLSELPDGFYFLEVHQAPSAGQLFDVEGLIGVSLNANAQQGQLNLVLGMSSCGLSYTNAGACLQGEIQTRSISGRVVDEEGAAIPRADVLLSTDAAVPAPIRNTTTDLNGTFVFHDYPAGSYFLEVTAPGFTPARATLRVLSPTTPEPERVRIELGLLGRCSAVAIP